jgi:hypothetical protein
MRQATCLKNEVAGFELTTLVVIGTDFFPYDYDHDSPSSLIIENYYL